MTVPDEAIEAAAKAMAPVVKKLEALILARAALEAAAPYLRAQALEDAADEMTRDDPGDGPWGTPAYEHQATWLRARAAAERGPDV